MRPVRVPGQGAVSLAKGISQLTAHDAKSANAQSLATLALLTASTIATMPARIAAGRSGGHASVTEPRGGPHRWKHLLVLGHRRVTLGHADPRDHGTTAGSTMTTKEA